MVLRSCLYCEQEYQAEERYLKRGQGKYCSQSCASKYAAFGRRQQVQPNSICALPTCGAPFYRAPSKKMKSKSGLLFCSKSHKDIAQEIGGLKQIHPSHYKDGGGRYRGIAFRAHPHECNRCKYSKIVEVLVVHHKDRDRTNNSRDNLEILCPTCHSEEHFQAGDGMWK